MREIATRLFVAAAVVSFLVNIVSVGLNVVLVDKLSSVTVAEFKEHHSAIYDKLGSITLYEFEFVRGIDLPFRPVDRSGVYACGTYDGQHLGGLELGVGDRWEGATGSDFWKARYGR